jgi:hypothetical protein
METSILTPPRSLEASRRSEMETSILTPPRSLGTDFDPWSDAADPLLYTHPEPPLSPPLRVEDGSIGAVSSSVASMEAVSSSLSDGYVERSAWIQSALNGVSQLSRASGLADEAERWQAGDTMQATSSAHSSPLRPGTASLLPHLPPAAAATVEELLDERRALLRRAAAAADECSAAVSDEEARAIARAVVDSDAETALSHIDSSKQFLVFRVLHIAGRLRENASALKSSIQ